MTLTARETMQALLDGKTLKYDRNGLVVHYKLDDKGNLLQTYGCAWEVLRSWTLADLEVYEEYPLTFEQALREMLDGKVVMNEFYSHLKQRFHNGCFECGDDDDNAEWRDAEHFPCLEQKSRWKVIE